MSMDKWDKHFIDLAKLVAGWSKDPSTQVGAVIVDDKHRVVSLGYNGLPHGVSDSSERLHDREAKLHMVIHAEENALLFANQPVAGCTAYVWPLPPCARCASKLIQSGIRRVVVSGEGNERWHHENKLAFELLSEVGVVVDIDEKSPIVKKRSLHEIQERWVERWVQQDL